MAASMHKAKQEGADLVELCIDSFTFSHISQVEHLFKHKELCPPSFLSGHWALAFLNRSDGKTVGVDGDGNRVGERGDHQIFHYPVVDIAEVVLFKPLGSNFGLYVVGFAV
ncbi:hypothetical protein FXO38_01028, partial [Capsicum annuum]